MEKITLRLFWASMLACASCFITAIWLGEDVAPEALFKAGATLFIIGLANFLIWAPLMVYRFLSALRS
ncbi:MAG: hypothetical protein WAW13_04035 [Minisyncoccia bacterium]